MLILSLQLLIAVDRRFPLNTMNNAADIASLLQVNAPISHMTNKNYHMTNPLHLPCWNINFMEILFVNIRLILHIRPIQILIPIISGMHKKKKKLL